MPAVGDSYVNPRTGARLDVVEAGDEGGNLVVRRIFKPGEGKLAKHYHLDLVERFTIESGTATAVLGREKRTLRAGDELAVPIGGHHKNPYNEGDEDLVFLHAFEPSSVFTDAFVDTFGRLLAEDGLSRNGEMPLPVAFAIADRTDSQSYATGVPRGFQRRVVAPLGARLARRRGVA